MSALDLCAPFGDVLKQPEQTTFSQLNDASIFVYRCGVCGLSALFDHARNWRGGALYEGVVAGSSAEFCEDDARFKSACEAAERYSTSVLLNGEYRIATHDELGTEAFDWRSLARLNDEELADEHQMFSLFSPSDPMRWVRGLHVTSGQKKWLPTVMTHLFPRPWSTERFVAPISTGTALHSDEVVAISSAINEVVERDAIALTWLLRRPIKRIVFDASDLGTFSKSVAAIASMPEFRLYDATTDVGVPTVYARRIRPGHEKACNIIACASAFDYRTAIEKVLTEVVMISRTFEQGSFVPVKDMMDCESVHDGAAFMARAEYAHAFEFLDGNGDVSFQQLVHKEPSFLSNTRAEKLRWLLGQLSALSMDVYLVNLTSDELVDVELRCYRAIIPQLMPMSLMRRARFLDTQRLRATADKEGLVRNFPQDINQMPQPFA